MARISVRSDRGFVWQTHPLYDEWYEQWKLAGEVYEGDGGFLDGSNLVAHPRELIYQYDDEGRIVNDRIIGEKQKYKRRRALARYENWAQSLIDIFVDHQYAKLPARTFAGVPDRVAGELLPIEQWWQDVDGRGTAIDDWLKETQTLANLYGHVHVLMDQEYRPKPARTRAEQGMPVLRVYTPEDTLDWLAPRKRLTAVKFVEAEERQSLREPSSFADARMQSETSTKDLPNVNFFFWDERQFEVYDREGKRRRWGHHGFGEIPVEIFFSRKRARIPLIGRSLLRDPRVFKDHYNLISEQRAIMRDQTFSLLNIQLGETETVVEARSRLGDHAGTDTILWTKGGAAFISPADGPAARYALEIEALERKFFRLMGLPWETDSADVESEGSRKLKAQDLNRLLAGQADQAERFEYRISRLFYIAYYGRDLGLKRLERERLKIKHPDEFNTEQLMQVAAEAREALGLNLGATAEKLIKKGIIEIMVPNVSPEDRKQIEAEIDAQPTQAELEDSYKRQMAAATTEGLAESEGEGEAA